MAAQAIRSLSGLKVIPQLMALGFINACVVIALEQRILQKQLTIKSLLFDALNVDHGSL
jgi:hypothetical protein